MNNHNTKFEYKGIKTAWVNITQTRHPKHFGWEQCLSSTALKIRKYLLNVHKMGGEHHQCVNNHYEKFEYKVMNTVEVTDYTN